MIITRGQVQLRGRLRWMARRAQVRWRYGSEMMDSLPVVFGNAIPKAGSKLLFNILRGFTELGPFVDTGLNEIKPFFRDNPTSPAWIQNQLDALRPGDIRFGYIYYSDRFEKILCQNGWANFLIIRDPRDQIISEIYYAMHINPEHKLHKLLQSLDGMEARISVLITGIPQGELKRVSVYEHYEHFFGWLNKPEIHVVRFEDLVNEPLKQLERMLDFIKDRGFEPVISRHQALELLLNRMSPDKSETFREGTSGQWREHFSDKNIDQFIEITGDLLAHLGYE
jgi:hypothetical protein